MNGLIGITIALALQHQPTVAVTLPDQSVVVMAQQDAESQFKRLCSDGSDDLKLKAMAVALNPMPNWPQMVMNGDASVCNRNPKPLPVVSVGTTWP